MAVENFVEMSAKTADPHFLFRKKLQHKLGNEFPAHFMSRYEMVSFSNLPYSVKKF
jgi:kynurenine 3-monooxygenase